ncbi:MAG: type I-E CRISPR-associated protein Cas7/Cse4/CasC [Desulfobacterales bacterium]|nr:type I-E CRISPR-associated protein Cas7/Cse4/CasC [Desulfobacterales bacterium]
MSHFIQLHLLTVYPPSNLNRDDLGRPKTAIMGGVERLRISSQSLKRAWRTSELFKDALDEWKGERTKLLGTDVFKQLTENGVNEKSAAEWASKIAAHFGKLKGKNALEIEQLAHIAPEEKQKVMALVDTLVSENRGPEEDELLFLCQRPKSVDIALFGRMLASSPNYNVEAAVQVAHAITVNQVKIDDDFFTAVDDLNKHVEDSGSAHMGELGFGSGVFYIYLCINKSLLIKNLNEDRSKDLELTNKTLAALVECATKVAPTGKQNSFASRAYTSYLLAEKGAQQPRTLSAAFLKPVRGEDHLALAIRALETQQENFDRVYGQCADASVKFNALTGEGKLEEIIRFVTE